MIKYEDLKDGYLLTLSNEKADFLNIKPNVIFMKTADKKVDADSLMIYQKTGSGEVGFYFFNYDEYSAITHIYDKFEGSFCGEDAMFNPQYRSLIYSTAFDIDAFKDNKIVVACDTRDEARNFMAFISQYIDKWYAGQQITPCRLYWNDEEKNLYGYDYGMYHSIDGVEIEEPTCVEWSDCEESKTRWYRTLRFDTVISMINGRKLEREFDSSVTRNQIFFSSEEDQYVD